MQECYKISKTRLFSQEHKITVRLDSETGDGRLIRKMLCLFFDIEGEPISLSEQTTLTFHSLVEKHAGHSSHHYNFHLGKKKEDFTRRKQEEEGLPTNPFIWILDFGWAFHDEHIQNHANQIEFTFHFDKRDVFQEKEMISIAFFEDDDTKDYDFGWLLSRLESIPNQKAPDVIKLCKHIFWL
jgi:hypothetical protein